MFAQRLIFPFVMLALLALYLTWSVDETYSLWIVPPVLISAAIYVFAPQINWWWYLRTPPPMDPMVKTLLGKHLPFYDRLSPDDKKKFDHRLGLYQMSIEWRSQGMDQVPADVQGLISACPVWLTFNRDDFTFEKFEDIVVYPHAFPSPQYPRTLHSSEIFEEDGVIIFSLEHFMPGFLETKKYYQIGLHEYAKIFRKTYPNENYPTLNDDFWQKLPQINGLTKAKLEQFIGLKDLEPFPVAVVHYFVFPEKFEEVFPTAATALKNIFGAV